MKIINRLIQYLLKLTRVWNSNLEDTNVYGTVKGKWNLLRTRIKRNTQRYRWHNHFRFVLNKSPWTHDLCEIFTFSVIYNNWRKHDNWLIHSVVQVSVSVFNLILNDFNLKTEYPNKSTWIKNTITSQNVLLKLLADTFFSIFCRHSFVSIF